MGRNKKPDNYVGFLKKEEKMNMPLTQVSPTGPSDKWLMFISTYIVTHDLAPYTTATLRTLYYRYARPREIAGLLALIPWSLTSS